MVGCIVCEPCSEKGATWLPLFMSYSENVRLWHKMVGCLVCEPCSNRCATWLPHLLSYFEKDHIFALWSGHMSVALLGKTQYCEY